MANNAVSFYGVLIILNSKESGNKYFSANVSTFQIVNLLLGNLFCARYRLMSLKYGLIKYPTCISFTATGKCVPLHTFLCIISFKVLSISACFCRNICTRLPVLIKPSNSQGSWKNDLSGLWYILEIMPSLNGEFSSKSILISGLIFVLSELCKLPHIGVLIGLGGGL